MTNLSKEQLNFDLVDKLYQNLIETGKIVRRLLVTFFTVMLLLSALAFEPGIFSINTPSPQPPENKKTSSEDLNSQDAQPSQEALEKLNDRTQTQPTIPVPFLGPIAAGAILKYSSLLLAVIFLMLATYLIYMDLLRTEFFEAYRNLFAEAGEDPALLEKIRFPSFHYVFADLACHHSSRFVQSIYQIVDVIKSFLLFVLPMFVVMKLLERGVQNTTSQILIGLFFLSPILVVTGTLALTRGWFVESRRLLSAFVKTRDPKKVRTRSLFDYAKDTIIMLATSVTLVAVFLSAIQVFRASVIQVRVAASTLSVEQVKTMLKEKNFYDSDWNSVGAGAENDYKRQPSAGDTVIVDHVTGLTWQQSGSRDVRFFPEASEYIQSLNEQKFAGHSDWRLPTLEEAMSLMEPTRMNGDLYIDPRFDKTQRWIWTSDKYAEGPASSAWVVYFDFGGCYGSRVDGDGYVRAVR